MISAMAKTLVLANRATGGRIVTHQAVRERLTNHLNNKGILRNQLRRRFQLLRAKQGVKLGNPTNLESKKEYNQLCYVLLGSLYKRGNTKRKGIEEEFQKISHLSSFFSQSSPSSFKICSSTFLYSHICSLI